MSARAWRGEFDARAAAHLWRRAGFGADRDTLSSSVERGLDATLADIFARREHDSALVKGIYPLLALEELAPVQAWWMALILRERAPPVRHACRGTPCDFVRQGRNVRLMGRSISSGAIRDFRLLLRARGGSGDARVARRTNRRGQLNASRRGWSSSLGTATTRARRAGGGALSPGWGVDGRAVFREQLVDGGTNKCSAGRAFGGEADRGDPRATGVPRYVARRLLAGSRSRSRATRRGGVGRVLVAEDWNIERTLSRLLRSSSSSGPHRGARASPLRGDARSPPHARGEHAPGEAGPRRRDGSVALPSPERQGLTSGVWIHAGSWLTLTTC